MVKKMNIKNLMTKDIITCDIKDTLKDAALLMLNYDIGFLPIKKDNKVVGVLTDRDIVIYGIANDNKNIKEIMQKKLISIDENDSLSGAIEIMKKNKIRRLLVKKDKKLTGILAISDIINSFSNNKSIVEMLKCILEINKNNDISNLKVSDFEL